jgi:hypothetical protein
LKTRPEAGPTTEGTIVGGVQSDRPIPIVRTLDGHMQKPPARLVSFERQIKKGGDEMLVDFDDPLFTPNGFVESLQRFVI